MNTKARITKLETAQPVQPATDDRKFLHCIGAEGVTYFVDGFDVDAGKFALELKAHNQSNTSEDQKIQVSIIGYDAIEEDKDGDK